MNFLFSNLLAIKNSNSFLRFLAVGCEKGKNEKCLLRLTILVFIFYLIS